MTSRKPSERQPKGPLRKGWTTGACATAAATAAYQALLTGSFPDPVTITLPKGQEPSFKLIRADLGDGRATAAVVKDAGDDPDVTHGAQIIVTVALTGEGRGISFHAGEGVGTVTRPGLALDVGEPAINPGPRAMMEGVIRGLAREYGCPGDVAITVAVPGGETLAQKTLNGRLGIKGGLSILGTTGIVIPYSCSSWIHSIHRGVDVARASGITHIAAATGSTSEAAIQKMLGLDDVALIDMGDFAGGLLKYLRKKPVERLTIAGGPGKLAKLSQGHLDLHSSKSRLDMTALAGLLVGLGPRGEEGGEAEAEAVAAAGSANTAAEALETAASLGLPLADRIARQAREVALATLAGDTRVEVVIFDRGGKPVGRSGDNGG